MPGYLGGGLAPSASSQPAGNWNLPRSALLAILIQDLRRVQELVEALRHVQLPQVGEAAGPTAPLRAQNHRHGSEDGANRLAGSGGTGVNGGRVGGHGGAAGRETTRHTRPLPGVSSPAADDIAVGQKRGTKK